MENNKEVNKNVKDDKPLLKDGSENSIATTVKGNPFDDVNVFNGIDLGILEVPFIVEINPISVVDDGKDSNIDDIVLVGSRNDKPDDY